MKILETSRLYLRTLEDTDASRMSAYRNKKEVAKYQTWKHYTIKEATTRIQMCQNIKAFDRPRSNYHLAIVLKDEDLMIGDLFVDIASRRYFVLGYTLDSAYWSCGYASEIVDAFCDYMKETYHFKKVICYVYRNNVRSKNLLIKLGFKKFDQSYFYGDESYMRLL